LKFLKKISVMSSRNGPPSKRGRIDPNQTLSPQEVEQELSRENPSGGAPNRIVLLTILNAHYPITVDIVHKICKNLGPVDRIVIFQKFFVQASFPVHMFLGPPGPDPFVRVMDPDPGSFYHQVKEARKTSIPTCFVTSFGLFMFE
jgi:hypothetical protein